MATPESDFPGPVGERRAGFDPQSAGPPAGREIRGLQLISSRLVPRSPADCDKPFAGAVNRRNSSILPVRTFESRARRSFPAHSYFNFWGLTSSERHEQYVFADDDSQDRCCAIEAENMFMESKSAPLKGIGLLTLVGGWAGRVAAVLLPDRGEELASLNLKNTEERERALLLASSADIVFDNLAACWRPEAPREEIVGFDIKSADERERALTVACGADVVFEKLAACWHPEEPHDRCHDSDNRAAGFDSLQRAPKPVLVNGRVRFGQA